MIAIGALLAAYVVGGLMVYAGNLRAVEPASWDPLPSVEKKQKLRLILLGDTGMPGAQRDAVRKQVLLEEKDAIIALGDLIYPNPPPCETGAVEAKDLAFYEERVARGLEGLRAGLRHPG